MANLKERMISRVEIKPLLLIDYVSVFNPEAMGINVFETSRRAGLILA